MTQDGTVNAPCPKCNGTGKVQRVLRLVRGRGANFYRHGAYATQVQVIGPRPGDPCAACGGSGRVAS
jgi:DnaJ-class molecular chaperone